MTPDERADLDDELDQVERRTRRWGTAGAIFCAISFCSLITAQVTQNWAIQLASIPIGIVAGFAVVKLALWLDARLATRRSS